MIDGAMTRDKDTGVEVWIKLDINFLLSTIKKVVMSARFFKFIINNEY